MTAPETDKLARAAAFATGVALFAWFLFLIRGGLACWFDADDLMNCYYYWSRPWSALAKANLAFWSTYYRPGTGAACGELRAHGPRRVAAYGSTMGYPSGLDASHQPGVRQRVFRYRNYL